MRNRGRAHPHPRAVDLGVVLDPQHDVIVRGMTQLAFSAALHMGMRYRAADLRALSRSLVYQALVDEKR